MLNKKNLVCGLLIGYSGIALAASDASIRFEQSVLSYDSKSAKVKPNGQKELTEKSTDLNQMATYNLRASVGDWYLQTVPGKVTPLSIGFHASKNLSVHVSLGLGTKKGEEVTKAKTSENTTAFGLGGLWTQGLGGNDLEVGLGFDYANKKGENTDAAGVKTKIGANETSFGLGANYVVKVTKNLHTTHGLSLAMVNGKVTEGAKATSKATKIGINLLTLRYFM